MSSAGFVHLHVHSAYSLLKGSIKIAKLGELAKADRQPALALTDTDSPHPDLARLYRMGDSVTGLRYAFAAPGIAGRRIRELAEGLGGSYYISDWSRRVSFRRTDAPVLASNAGIAVVASPLVMVAPCRRRPGRPTITAGLSGA